MTHDDTPAGVDASTPDGASFIDRALRLDVRKAPAYLAATHSLPDAQWRDPSQVDTWARLLPAGAAVLVYCVHGHEVSQTAAALLRAAGVDARYLQGGFERWAGQGRPISPKGSAA